LFIVYCLYYHLQLKYAHLKQASEATLQINLYKHESNPNRQLSNGVNLVQMRNPWGHEEWQVGSAAY
jgi:hypothetical protein